MKDVSFLPIPSIKRDWLIFWSSGIRRRQKTPCETRDGYGRDSSSGGGKRRRRSKPVVNINNLQMSVAENYILR
jgi:hypothetical protein